MKVEMKSTYFVLGILRGPHVPTAHARTPMGAPAAASGNLTFHSADVTTTTCSYAEHHLLAGSCSISATIKEILGKPQFSWGLGVWWQKTLKFTSECTPTIFNQTQI